MIKFAMCNTLQGIIGLNPIVQPELPAGKEKKNLNDKQSLRVPESILQDICIKVNTHLDQHTK